MSSVEHNTGPIQKFPISSPLDKKDESIVPSFISVAESVESQVVSPKTSHEQVTIQETILDQMELDMQAAEQLVDFNMIMECSQNSAELTNMGRNILKGIDGLGLEFGPNAVDLNIASVSSDIVANIGSGLAGTFQLVSLLSKSREWNQLRTLVSEKESELAALPQKHDKNYTEHIQNQEVELTREMTSLNEQIDQLARDTALGLLCAGISLSSDSLNNASRIVSFAAPAAAHTSYVLGAAAGSATVVGSSIAMGITAHNIYKLNQEVAAIISEKNRLLKNLEEPALDPAVKSVIEMRIRALDQMHEDAFVSMAKDSLAFTCATIGTVSTIASLSLAAAGVGTGLAATAVTTAGIGVAVLGAGLLAGGLGYAAYKNRKIIEIRLEQAAQVSKVQVGKLQIKQTKASLKQIDKLILKTQEKIKKINQRAAEEKRVLEEEVDVHQQLIAHYVEQKIQPDNKGGGVQEYLDGQLNQEFGVVGKLQRELDAIDHNKEMLVEKEMNQLNQLTSKATSVFQDVKQLHTNIRFYKGQKELLQIEAKLEKLSQHFEGTTPDELRKIADTWVKTFHHSLQSKKAVKNFIFNEGHISIDFDPNPIGQIFSYLTSKPREEKAA